MKYDHPSSMCVAVLYTSCLCFPVTRSFLLSTQLSTLGRCAFPDCEARTTSTRQSPHKQFVFTSHSRSLSMPARPQMPRKLRKVVKSASPRSKVVVAAVVIACSSRLFRLLFRSSRLTFNLARFSLFHLVYYAHLLSLVAEPIMSSLTSTSATFFLAP